MNDALVPYCFADSANLHMIPLIANGRERHRPRTWRALYKTSWTHEKSLFRIVRQVCKSDKGSCSFQDEKEFNHARMLQYVRSSW
jgi:hypothetical protein